MQGFRAGLRIVWSGYVGVGTIYGFWVLLVTQFRDCGLFTCLPDYWWQFLVVIYSIAVGVFRGALWLPNLILSILQGTFVSDWVLLQDVTPLATIISN